MTPEPLHCKLLVMMEVIASSEVFYRAYPLYITVVTTSGGEGGWRMDLLARTAAFTVTMQQCHYVLILLFKV